MKKLLLPVLMVLIVGITLTGCDPAVDDKTDGGIVPNISYLEVTADTDGFFEGNNIKDYLTVKFVHSDGLKFTVPKDDYTTDLADDLLSSDTTSVTITYMQNDTIWTKDIQIRIREMIGKDWFSNFAGMNKSDVTSVSFGRQAAPGASLVSSTDDLSYYRKDNDIYVVGTRIVFQADSSEMFRGFENAAEIVFDDNIDTSRVTSMNNMFTTCRIVESLDLSNFNTSNVQDMSWMFNYCEDLQTVDLSGFDTSEVTDMEYMFCRCYDLQNLDVTCFNTSNVEDMKNMFNFCEKLTSLDLGSFDVSNVTSSSSMFTKCGYTGTEIMIDPRYEAFFNGTGLSDDSVWEYDASTFTYTKLVD